MPTFKQYMIYEGPRHARGYKTPNLHHEQIFQYVTKYAETHGLPTPTNVAQYGTEATIFDSDDVNVIIRAEHIKSEKDTSEYLLKSLEDTGGVVKIYHIDTIPIRIEEKRALRYVISWKEVVDTDVADFLMQKYGKEDAKHFKVAMSYMSDEDNIELLAHYPETKGLADAIKRGLPTDDLSYEFNTGVTEDGRIVAFDC